MKILGTNITNLVRDGETGIYYARVKINGKINLRSLGEDCTTKEKAKLRLPDKIEEIRKSAGFRPTITLSPRATFGETVEIYRSNVALMDLADSSKERRLSPANRAKDIWPEFHDLQLKTIHGEQLLQMMADLRAGKFPYSPPNSKGKTLPGNSSTVINSMLGFFKHVFEVGIQGGVISSNPALHKELKRKTPKKKILSLPPKKDFLRMVDFVRNNAARGQITADLIEGLAYSGMRVAEAGRMQWQHLDFSRGMMTVYGTKSPDSARHVPMIPDFIALTERIKKRVGDVQSTDYVFKAKSAAGCLELGSDHIGHSPKLKHHNLRDLFATTVIESGVDVPTLAGWLGHADGGVLAMKVYGHIRAEHSKKAALMVKFRSDPAPTPEPTPVQTQPATPPFNVEELGSD